MAGWYILFNTCLSNISLILSSLFLHQSYYTAFKVVAICQAVSVETRDMDWVERPFRFCQSGLIWGKMCLIISTLDWTLKYTVQYIIISSSLNLYIIIFTTENTLVF